MKKFIKTILLIGIIGGIVFCFTKVNATSENIEKPDVKISISGVKNIKLKWNKQEDAVKYTIYRATSLNGKYKKIATTKSTSYVNKNLKRGKKYFYKVTASGKDITSKKSKAVSKKVPTKAKALKEIRKALKNKTWLNNNVKMIENCFEEKISSNAKQVLTFRKIPNKEVVLVQAYCEKELSSKVFLVGYVGGKVISNPATEYVNHINHSGISIDTRKSILCDSYVHRGLVKETYYEVKNNAKTKKLKSFETNEATLDSKIYYQINNKKVSNSKYVKQLKKYNANKFSIINIKLTNKKIDKYIK